MAKFSKFAFGVVLAATSGLFYACGPTRDKQVGWSPEWNDIAQRTWYSTSQGSRLLPSEWGDALSDPADPSRSITLIDLATRHGFPVAQDDLPLGFVPDREDGQGGRNFIGLTCAACHTGQFSFADQVLRVHGAPNVTADLYGLLEAVFAAVKLVRENPTARKRFLDAVLGETRSTQAEMREMQRVDEWLEWRGAIRPAYAPTYTDVTPWGPGRTDALGMLLSSVILISDNSESPKLPLANAPVSIPPVWNTDQQARLQYNGSIKHAEGGSIGVLAETNLTSLLRNWTEAMGVFSRVSMTENSELESTIRFDGLIALEDTLKSLPSPRWPDDLFGAADAERALQGMEIYAQNCQSCHRLLDPDDLKTRLSQVDADGEKTEPGIVLRPVVDASLTSNARIERVTPTATLIGTDPMMACNAIAGDVPAGKLAGKPVSGVELVTGDLGEFGDLANPYDLILALYTRDISDSGLDVVEALFEKEIKALASLLTGFLFGDAYVGSSVYRPRGRDAGLQLALTLCADRALAMSPEERDLRFPNYKARPLNGIWASPPYLHNGSVPSLRDLLEPQSNRPAEFVVSNMYDPKKVGLDLNATGPKFSVYDDKGNAILGNWNGGHEYATTLSDFEKDALVEYLKGL